MAQRSTEKYRLQVLNFNRNMKVQIRKAKSEQAEVLTAIAHAAKRHWGYPESWIVQWKTDLTISPDFILNHEVFVACVGDKIVGCFALVLSESAAEIEHMWIDPARMGCGIGRALFMHATKRARELHVSALELSADPHAEKFYERMGARRIGEIRADMEGQPRFLPRMKIEF